MQILEKIREAGVVGCGGAGFPTHIKLKADGTYFLINGAECEPLLRTDRTINASAIARRLGGGGHPRAAGCEISGNLENAKHAILQEVKKELDRMEGANA